MSRQTWMDRTIEAARDSDIRMPWARRPAPVAPAEEAPAAQTAALRARR
ncbi:hypothetical protein [Jannaschia marina]|nr:hypothetical protein [Jannaschia marina]